MSRLLSYMYFFDFCSLPLDRKHGYSSFDKASYIIFQMFSLVRVLNCA